MAVTTSATATKIAPTATLLPDTMKTAGIGTACKADVRSHDRPGDLQRSYHKQEYREHDRQRSQ